MSNAHHPAHDSTATHRAVHQYTRAASAPPPIGCPAAAAEVAPVAKYFSCLCPFTLFPIRHKRPTWPSSHTHAPLSISSFTTSVWSLRAASCISKSRQDCSQQYRGRRSGTIEMHARGLRCICCVLLNSKLACCIYQECVLKLQDSTAVPHLQGGLLVPVQAVHIHVLLLHQPLHDRECTLCCCHMTVNGEGRVTGALAGRRQGNEHVAGADQRLLRQPPIAVSTCSCP